MISIIKEIANTLTNEYATSESFTDQVLIVWILTHGNNANKILSARNTPKITGDINIDNAYRKYFLLFIIFF